MKKFAVICEYNPLHSGHEYLLNVAREQFSADRVYCVMSGSFVQRAEPAVCDRFTRAKWAIGCGADLVAEMPGLSGSLSADDFAYFGVRSAMALGATHLLFGSESGDINALLSASDKMQSPKFKSTIKALMDTGVGYPSAVSKALKSDLDLSQPNNLLGLAYVNAIRKLGSPIIPVTVKRIGSYHATDGCEGYMSASAVRSALTNSTDVSEYVKPEILGDILPFDRSALQKFEEFCLARAVGATKQDFANLFEVSEGLENRLTDCAKSAKTMSELVDSIKTKRYTTSRIRRVITYLALGITKDFVTNLRRADYVRVLAVKKDDALLADLAEHEGVYLKYGALPDELKPIWQAENSAGRLRDLFSQGRSCQNGQDNAIIII